MKEKRNAHLNQLRSETILRLLGEATSKSRKPARKTHPQNKRIQLVRVSKRLKDIIVFLASLTVVEGG